MVSCFQLSGLKDASGFLTRFFHQVHTVRFPGYLRHWTGYPLGGASVQQAVLRNPRVLKSI